VERHLKHAKEVQALMPELEADLKELWSAMRLFERKILVAKAMEVLFGTSGSAERLLIIRARTRRSRSQRLWRSRRLVDK